VSAEKSFGDAAGGNVQVASYTGSNVIAKFSINATPRSAKEPRGQYRFSTLNPPDGGEDPI